MYTIYIMYRICAGCAKVIDAEWAESFLNPPIFDNLEDEAGQKAQARLFI